MLLMSKNASVSNYEKWHLSMQIISNVFASFSSLVKGSVEFPGNNETLLTY